MDEKEWLNATDPEPMLDVVRGKTSDRKQRLFAAACFWSAPHLLTDAPTRKAVEMLERRADGNATGEELKRAAREAREAHFEIATAIRGSEGEARSIAALIVYRLLIAGTATYAGLDACRTARLVFNPEREDADFQAAVRSRDEGYCRLVREVFGNPFRAPPLDPAWLAWSDGVVKKMAEAIYEQRSFDRMPLLADALEEAGCADADILSHCREQGAVHVRGCWVGDLLLGKL